MAQNKRYIALNLIQYVKMYYLKVLFYKIFTEIQFLGRKVAICKGNAIEFRADFAQWHFHTKNVVT